MQLLWLVVLMCLMFKRQMLCRILLWLMWKRWLMVKSELVDIQKVREIVPGLFIIKSGFLVNLEVLNNVRHLIVNFKRKSMSKLYILAFIFIFTLIPQHFDLTLFISS